MAYTETNFKTKKALKDALKLGMDVNVYQPGNEALPLDGTVYLEGPHYPAPHSWYAQGTMKDGKLVSVK